MLSLPCLARIVEGGEVREFPPFALSANGSALEEACFETLVLTGETDCKSNPIDFSLPVEAKLFNLPGLESPAATLKFVGSPLRRDLAVPLRVLCGVSVLAVAGVPA